MWRRMSCLIPNINPRRRRKLPAKRWARSSTRQFLWVALITLVVLCVIWSVLSKWLPVSFVQKRNGDSRFACSNTSSDWGVHQENHTSYWSTFLGVNFILENLSFHHSNFFERPRCLPLLVCCSLSSCYQTQICHISVTMFSCASLSGHCNVELDPSCSNTFG